LYIFESVVSTGEGAVEKYDICDCFDSPRYRLCGLSFF